MNEVTAAAEIAEYLGVTRQRTAVLVERAGFPAPIAHSPWRATR